MNYEKVIEAIEMIAPRHLAEDWDNSGFQIRTKKQNINKVLVCLDVTLDIIGEAKQKNVDLIIAHHPLFFNPIKTIDALATELESQMASLNTISALKAEVDIYAAHTSFDMAAEGNNVYLARLLNLNDVSAPSKETPISIGILEEPQALADFAHRVARTLDMDRKTIKFAGDDGAIIKKVGICTGSGATFLDIAYEHGCDVLVTGDVKHDRAMIATHVGPALLDAGHFGTEKIFVENFAIQLSRSLPELAVLKSEKMIAPFSY